jgi:chromosome segregation ATPase
MALARERLGGEVKNLGELIDREIMNAGEWPPPPEISINIKKRSMALGARAVKLLDAVDKLENARIMLEHENDDLSTQVHELRMKSSGISPAELAHLKMENEVLKEHVGELEKAIAGEGSETASLQAENANLAAKLKELEEELNGLLGASSEAAEAKEAAEALQKKLEETEMELETLKSAASGREPGTGLLASVWAEQGEEASETDVRIAALKEKIEALEVENDSLIEKGRKRLEEVKKQRDDLALKVVELAESSAERAEHAIEEIVVLQKERDQLKEQLGQGGAGGPQKIEGETIKDLQKVIKSLEEHIGELEEELDGKEEEIRRLQEGGKDA